MNTKERLTLRQQIEKFVVKETTYVEFLMNGNTYVRTIENIGPVMLKNLNQLIQIFDMEGTTKVPCKLVADAEVKTVQEIKEEEAADVAVDTEEDEDEKTEEVEEAGDEGVEEEPEAPDEEESEDEDDLEDDEDDEEDFELDL